jgi:hypothetical protein
MPRASSSSRRRNWLACSIELFIAAISASTSRSTLVSSLRIEPIALALS